MACGDDGGARLRREEYGGNDDVKVATAVLAEASGDKDDDGSVS